MRDGSTWDLFPSELRSTTAAPPWPAPAESQRSGPAAELYDREDDQSSTLAQVESCDLGSDGRWLLSQTMNTYSYDAKKDFGTTDEYFMKSNFRALIMTNPAHSAFVAQSSRCAQAFRSAIEHHLRIFPMTSARGLRDGLREFNKSTGVTWRMEVYAMNYQRVRLHTGAVIPVVFAQAIDSFMRSENPSVLTGVIQMAMSVIPDSGELHPWRPKA